MPFEKGHGRMGGRPKGKVNEATLRGREAIGRFVDGNAHRLEEWLDRVAKTDPEAAFKLFQSVVEYHVPKLARSEMTGADGKDLVPSNIQVTLVRAAPTT